MTSYNILLLSGDGIGPEVVGQAKRVLEAAATKFNFSLSFDEALIGGSAYDAVGTPFPDETLAKAKASDAILLGAVGGPKWESLDISVRPERGLLGLRKELGLFANLRPCICFDELADASSLKKDIIAGLDILIVRELTGGIYFGEPKGVEELADGQQKGYNTLVYTTSEIERIAKVAFDLAKKRNGRVCSVDKANVLVATELWRNVVSDVQQKNYSDVELSHMYVDNAAMQLVRNPGQFDVVVTTNMFGDILSDIGAQLTGSLGMLPSASLGATGEVSRPSESSTAEGVSHARGVAERGDIIKGVYEPVHGSAPDIAGQGLANPIATILSAAMMLRYSLGQAEAADAIEQAVQQTLSGGFRTADIMQEGMSKLGTEEMGTKIVSAIEK